MSRLAHMAVFVLYIAAATAVAVAGPRFISALDQGTAILIGAVLFLSCALLQESFARRADALAGIRRLLLLKRVLDRNREELAVARDEVRRLFEAIEASGDKRIIAALDAAGLRHPEPPDGRPIPRRLERDEAGHSDEEDARQLFQQMEKSAYPPSRAGSSAEPTRGSSDTSGSGRANSATNQGLGRGRDRNADADRSMREAKAEVRILHNLVEQLYAGRDKPPVSLSEGATALPGNNSASVATPRPEPRLSSVPRRQEPSETSNPPSSGLRAALKVVAGGGETSPLAAQNPAPLPETEADSALLTTIREALRADRVDLYLQPIVSLPQRKRRFYECFSRVRAADGRIFGPDEYMSVARQAGLQTAIDNMLLFRCVQLLRKLRRKDFTAAFFCNIAPHTLNDREFFRDFIEYMESHAELAPSLVLEFHQSDLGEDFGGVSEDLDRLGKLGYRFSLDNVSNLSLDLDALEAHHFAFIKIDSGTVLNRLKKGGSDAAAIRGIKQEIDGRGIDLIVDRIESEATLLELLDFNIDFGQGYLFGEPRLSKEPAAT